MALEHRIAEASQTIATAFAEYAAEFRRVTRRAKLRFETRDWHGQQADALERLSLYPRAIERITGELRERLGRAAGSRDAWARIKLAYAADSDPVNFELARTFYNSATRRVFHTVGVNPDIEFASLDLVISDWEPDPRILRRHESSAGSAPLLRAILEDQRFDVAYRDLEGDVRLAAERLDRRIARAFGAVQSIAAELLRPVFYRNKAAYLVGRIEHDGASMPLVLALLNTPQGVVLDAVLTHEDEVSILFSFTRSYFHVDVACPRNLIVFLKIILPLKPVGDLYDAIGFNKHGKTELYRSLQRHLQRSSDRFEFTAGDRGLVMIVFTLPSYDRVFKVIRDAFVFPKNTTPRDVIERYRLVYRHDRVGRLVEAQRFRHLEIKAERFSDALLEELLAEATRSVKRDGDALAFDHLYVERKVTPLNVYLREADDEAACAAVIDYGAAIKELAAANIFPGDFLLKNFGVTRHGRVVFYDYDELCLLTDCTFRRLPVARTVEEELAAEPWFAPGEADIFPEEFRRFLGLPEALAELFERHHGDVFTAEFWLSLQRLHRDGRILNFFPYPRGERLHDEDPP